MSEGPRRDRGRRPRAESSPPAPAPEPAMPSAADFEKSVPEHFLKGFQELERIRQRGDVRQEDQIPFASRALGRAANYAEFKAASEKWLSLKRGERRKAEGLPEEKKRSGRSENKPPERKQERVQPPKEVPKFNPDGSHPLDIRPQDMRWSEWKAKRKALGLPAYPAHMQSRRRRGRGAERREPLKPADKKILDGVFGRPGEAETEAAVEHMTEEELLRGLVGLAPPEELEALSDTGEANVADAQKKFDQYRYRNNQEPKLAFKNASAGLTKNERAHLKKRLIDTGSWTETDLIDAETLAREEDERVKAALEAAKPKLDTAAVDKAEQTFLDTVKESKSFIEGLRAAGLGRGGALGHLEREAFKAQALEHDVVTESELQIGEFILDNYFESGLRELVEKNGPPSGIFMHVPYWAGKDGSVLLYSLELKRSYKLADGESYPFKTDDGHERWYWNTHEFVFDSKLSKEESEKLTRLGFSMIFNNPGRLFGGEARLIPRDEAIAEATERAQTPDDLKEMIARRFKGLGARLKLNPDSTGELVADANAARPARPARKRAKRAKSKPADDTGYMGDNWEREN